MRGDTFACFTCGLKKNRDVHRYDGFTAWNNLTTTEKDTKIFALAIIILKFETTDLEQHSSPKLFPADDNRKKESWLDQTVFSGVDFLYLVSQMCAVSST